MIHARVLKKLKTAFDRNMLYFRERRRREREKIENFGLVLAKNNPNYLKTKSLSLSPNGYVFPKTESLTPNWYVFAPKTKIFSPNRYVFSPKSQKA